MNMNLFTIGKSLLLFCILMFFSCKKGDVVTDPPPTGGGQTVRPVGQPSGDAYTEFIGSEGGTIQSPDGKITIVIPAGALSEETEIGIQPITNTAVSGMGSGYRLTPHGKIFKKKVTVRFLYADAVRRISSSKALEVAYQNEKGEWIAIGNAVKDPVQKTISVQTDHFSDWAYIASLELTPVVKTLGLSESVTLKAVHYIFPADEDGLVPLHLPEAGTGTPLLLDKRYIVGWTLHGPGHLEPKGNEAVYTAPSATPAEKTATVTVELNIEGKQVLLISTIQIIDEGISISIDGGPWQTYAGMATKVPDMNVFSLASLRISAEIPQIVFMWPLGGRQKADGVYQWYMWGSEENNVVFQYATPDLKTAYVSEYEDANHDFHDSPGFLSVEETEKGGKKYLTGMFVIDNAGVIETSTSNQVRTGSVVGTFNVQRNW